MLSNVDRLRKKGLARYWLCALFIVSILLGVACWVIGQAWVDVRGVIARHSDGIYGDEAEQEVVTLGGPKEAVRKIGAYWQLPATRCGEPTILLRILGKSGKEGVVLLSDVLRATVKSTDEDRYEVGSAAAEALGDTGSPLAVKALRAALACADSRVRMASVEALGRIRTPEAKNAVATAMSDAHIVVRKQAVYALLSHGDREPILKALTDDSWEVREVVVYAIGEFAKSEDTKHLIAALSDEDYHVRATACTSLAKMGDVKVMKPLQKALEDNNEVVVESAKWAVGNIRTLLVIHELTGQLDNPVADIRQMAVRHLGDLENTKAVAPLEALLKTEQNPDVRQAAREALVKIKKAQEEKQAKDKQPVEKPAKPD